MCIYCDRTAESKPTSEVLHLSNYCDACRIIFMNFIPSTHCYGSIVGFILNRRFRLVKSTPNTNQVLKNTFILYLII